MLLSPLLALYHTLTPAKRKEERRSSETPVELTHNAHPSASTTTETPNRTTRPSRKPRYSDIATPYVPGHLVAESSLHPPVRPRLDPSERSFEDVNSFQEAMDRAQAAFYEPDSPSAPQQQRQQLHQLSSAIPELVSPPRHSKSEDDEAINEDGQELPQRRPFPSLYPDAARLAEADLPASHSSTVSDKTVPQRRKHTSSNSVEMASEDSHRKRARTNHDPSTTTSRPAVPSENGRLRSQATRQSARQLRADEESADARSQKTTRHDDNAGPNVLAAKRVSARSTSSSSSRLPQMSDARDKPNYRPPSRNASSTQTRTMSKRTALSASVSASALSLPRVTQDRQAAREAAVQARKSGRLAVSESTSDGLHGIGAVPNSASTQVKKRAKQ